MQAAQHSACISERYCSAVGVDVTATTSFDAGFGFHSPILKLAKKGLSGQTRARLMTYLVEYISVQPVHIAYWLYQQLKSNDLEPRLAGRVNGQTLSNHNTGLGSHACHLLN